MVLNADGCRHTRNLAKTFVARPLATCFASSASPRATRRLRRGRIPTARSAPTPQLRFAQLVQRGETSSVRRICSPGILLAARLLVSRAGALQGPVSPTYQQAEANQMKRENHRNFLLLLFLTGIEFRHGAVVAFRFANVSIKSPLGNKANPPDSERPRQLRKRAHYGLICSLRRFDRSRGRAMMSQPGLERFRQLKHGATVPIPER